MAPTLLPGVCVCVRGVCVCACVCVYCRTASFGYNGQTRSLEKSVKEGTMFRVFLWWYPGDCTRSWRAPAPPAPPSGFRAEPRELLQFRETLSTQYADDAIRPIVEAFVASRAHDLLGPSLTEDDYTQRRNRDGGRDDGGRDDSPAPTPGSSGSNGGSSRGDDGGISIRGIGRGQGRTGWLPVGGGVGNGRDPYFDAGEQFDDFPPGLVDLWVRNVGTIPLRLYYRGPSPLGGQWNQAGVVPAGEGLKMTTQHLDEWHAVDLETEELLDAFEVDLSNGIVQDWLPAGYNGSS